MASVFFFNDTATTEIYTLSLHDALPIFASGSPFTPGALTGKTVRANGTNFLVRSNSARSEEHTSELQSRLHLVCRLLLEKKKMENLKTRIENDRLCRAQMPSTCCSVTAP